ncbi:hypothetical protein MKW98_011148 [Papaver atlanticum]|uniref:Uncharacterized protein n=1 Tax=Papaver atlanticum TaxID=357466 RepID=A0AAD4TI98_9MAGN|nr:hypothetical protein MKW98_011148 [Papaver atlanticum]
MQYLQALDFIRRFSSCQGKLTLLIPVPAEFSSFALSNFVRAQRILWYRNTLHARIVQLRLKFLTFSLN